LFATDEIECAECGGQWLLAPPPYGLLDDQKIEPPESLGLLNPVRVTSQGYIEPVCQEYFGNVPEWSDADELECTHCGSVDFWWLRGDGAECGNCRGKDFWWLRDGFLIDDADEMQENLWLEDDATDNQFEYILDFWLFLVDELEKQPISLEKQPIS
jgi:DNA-directed RNA polymerase subunit RPC12/RpoP